MPIIPIIPSINTCMSLTTTTTTSTNAKTPNVPQVNTTQLQALADVCSTVSSSSVNPISNAVMNSLVSPTKVVTNEDIINPIPTSAASNIEIPKKIPISIVSVPIMVAKEINSDSDDMHDMDEISPTLKTEDAKVTVKPITSENSDKEILPDVQETIKQDEKLEDDVVIEEKTAEVDSSGLSIDDNNLSPISAGNEPMECSSSLTSQISPKDDSGKSATVGNNEDVVMADTSSYSDNVNVCSKEISNHLQLQIF